MRPIDADSLISLVQDSTILGDGFKQAFVAIVNGEPTIEPEPQWIPWDSGSFPDDSGTYIVTAYDGAKERVTFAKYQKRLKRWELTGARSYWRVLAWMPLPEPYQGGREG